jgi:hypothetical protein
MSFPRADASRTLLRGALHGDWRRWTSHALVFAALLAVILAPLNLCCLRPHSSAPDVLLEASLPPLAHVALCVHDGRADPSDHPPGHARICPCCHLVNTAALDPSLTIKAAAYPEFRAKILAAPEIPGPSTRPPAFAGSPRAPPHLI